MVVLEIGIVFMRIFSFRLYLQHYSGTTTRLTEIQLSLWVHRQACSVKKILNCC